MPEMEFLKENDGLPSFLPAQRTRPQDPRITSTGRMDATQALGRSEVLITAENPARTIEQPVAAVVDDPFRYMDFRVSYADNVVTVNRGRIYTTFWVQADYQFEPKTYIIEEESITTALTATQTADVYFTLPVTAYGRGLAAPYPTPAQRVVDPDGGDLNHYHTGWSGFNLAEYQRRVALPAGNRKFSFLNTGFDLADWYFRIARVGPNFEVHHYHFGSIFLPATFAHELNSSP